MKIVSWDNLPKEMQNENVKKYYDILKEKKIQLIIKRTFDIIMASILLIIFIPFMILLGILIKMDSKGPVFFKQRRVTQYMKEFKIYKFRTMVNNADKIGSSITKKDDVRITKVGRLLRKTRLDETPQLINIIKGDMSFVGTRPEIPEYVHKYTNDMYATLLLPAGVTSIASIIFKNESEVYFDSDFENVQQYESYVLKEKMKYNLASIEKVSLFYDISVIFKTIFSVLF